MFLFTFSFTSGDWAASTNCAFLAPTTSETGFGTSVSSTGGGLFVGATTQAGTTTGKIFVFDFNISATQFLNCTYLLNAGNVFNGTSATFPVGLIISGTSFITSDPANDIVDTFLGEEPSGSGTSEDSVNGPVLFTSFVVLDGDSNSTIRSIAGSGEDYAYASANNNFASGAAITVVVRNLPDNDSFGPFVTDRQSSDPTLNSTSQFAAQLSMSGDSILASAPGANAIYVFTNKPVNGASSLMGGAPSVLLILCLAALAMLF